MTDDLNKPWACLGGYGEMVPYPRVCCSKEECKEVMRHLNERYDYWMNKLDMGRGE